VATRTEESKQFEEFRRTRDLSLRNRLVEANLHLADYHSRRYAARGASAEDLHQIALMAIIAAVDRYDPTVGTSFSTFASRTIEGECKRYLRDRTWAVRPPRALQELHLRVTRGHEELSHQLGRAPTAPELAEFADTTVEDVLEALEAGRARTDTSLDASSPRNGSSTGRTVGDMLGGAEDGYDLVEARHVAKALVANLSDRDRRIIQLRFVEERTESRIASELGVSQSYLSRRLHRILAGMRDDFHRDKNPSSAERQ
jgi:RNA polymerase sigma-B factor